MFGASQIEQSRVGIYFVKKYLKEDDEENVKKYLQIIEDKINYLFAKNENIKRDFNVIKKVRFAH